MSRRIDAPCSCSGHAAGRSCDAIPGDLRVEDTEHGPRLRDGKSIIDQAYERADSEARAAYQAGPPAGALIRRDPAAHIPGDVHVDTAGMSPIDAAYAREDARARAAHQAGPPEGAHQAGPPEGAQFRK